MLGGGPRRRLRRMFVLGVIDMKVSGMTVQDAYLLRLERDENVFSTLEEFCVTHGVGSATFVAIGAVKHTRLGYYDLEEKKYGSLVYEDDREVSSMTGNIALVDGKPFIHAHAVLSGVQRGTENQCVGGHVFESVVAVTLEVHLTAFNERITRSLDDSIGLKLLDCGVDR